MVIYPTIPQLLRTRFSRTRRLLYGRVRPDKIVIDINFAPMTLEPHQPYTVQPQTEIVIFDSQTRSQAQAFSSVAVPVRRVSQGSITSSAASSATKKTWLQPVIAWTSKILLAIFAVFSVVAAVIFLPQVYYSVFPSPDQPTMVEAFQPSIVEPSPQPTEPELPPQDPSLPVGDWVIIPRIGVRSELQPTADPEEALETGVWWVPDFGKPGDTDMPMIIASHRWGWNWWWKTLTDPEDPESLYAIRHSFYKLPETENGDLIEIISDQRRYVYEIYDGEEGDEITDYEADLILYTCKYLNSPIRHVKYARLIVPEPV